MDTIKKEHRWVSDYSYLWDQNVENSTKHKCC